MMPGCRVGIGFDIHRLKKGRPLFLGGVCIPHPWGLDGHSDADVLLHAITDAILGATGLDDIGVYFPPSDPAHKGISSSVMLAKAVYEAEKQGYTVVNVDSVLITEEPRIAPHRPLMRQMISRLLKIPASAVSVKGKTHEGLDSVGQKQAISAHAVVLIDKKARPSCRKAESGF